MADPFIVPRADYSWLANLPEQFAQGEQLGRQNALRNAMSKVPLGPSGEPDFGAMMKVMSQYGDPQDVTRLALAKSQMDAEAAFRNATLGIEGARLKAEYPWAKTGGQTGTQAAQGGPEPQTMGELAADKKYAGGDYLQWLQGGFSETEQNLKSLDHVREMLEKDDSLSGPTIGMFVKKSMAGNEGVDTWAARQFNTEAFNMAAAHQRAVVASLRPLVGARAAQQLFQSVLQTTYDPMASTKENARRIALVEDNIRKASEAKQKMAEYFQRNGTLSGYKGPIFDPDSFDPTEGVPDSSTATNSTGPMQGRSFVDPTKNVVEQPLNAPPVPGAMQPIQRDPRGPLYPPQSATPQAPGVIDYKDYFGQ